MPSWTCEVDMRLLNLSAIKTGFARIHLGWKLNFDYSAYVMYTCPASGEDDETDRAYQPAKNDNVVTSADL
jgi:hypothetical protein